MLDLAFVNFNVDSLIESSNPLVPPDGWHIPSLISFEVFCKNTNISSHGSFAFNKVDYLSLFKFLDTTDWSPIYV